jgi:hypothetical protein
MRDLNFALFRCWALVQQTKKDGLEEQVHRVYGPELSLHGVIPGPIVQTQDSTGPSGSEERPQQDWIRSDLIRAHPDNETPLRRGFFFWGGVINYQPLVGFSMARQIHKISVFLQSFFCYGSQPPNLVISPSKHS